MNQTISPITDKIRSIADAEKPHAPAFGTPTIFILQHGRYFQPQPLEIHELEIIQHVQWNSFPPRQCYRNAQCLAMKLHVTDHPHTVHYVEGFISVDNSILIQHAWLSINNKLVDPTLRWPVNNIENYGQEFEENDEENDGDDTEENDRENNGETNSGLPFTGHFPPNFQFFGVPLNPMEIAHIIEHDAHIPIIDDWQCQWPLLQRTPER